MTQVTEWFRRKLVSVRIVVGAQVYSQVLCANGRLIGCLIGDSKNGGPSVPIQLGLQNFSKSAFRLGNNQICCLAPNLG